MIALKLKRSAALLIAGCLSLIPVAADAAGKFTLRSADFSNGGVIPVAHGGLASSCSGSKLARQTHKNVMPTLSWSGAPGGTASFALVLYDPDLPKQYLKLFPHGFIHWVAYNIPATFTTLGPSSPHTYTNGKNGAGMTAYLGPCPPPGDRAHHYHFVLYALDLPRLTGPALTRDGLLAAIKGHILGTAQLIGLYQTK